METEGAEMLESLLPSKFKYRVKEVKILEQSEILEEVKFHACLLMLTSAGKWKWKNCFCSLPQRIQI